MIPRPLIASLLLVASVHAESPPQWEIPCGGNGYLTNNAPGDVIRPDGVQWQNPASVISLFFRVDRPADLDLSALLQVAQGESSIEFAVAGRKLVTTLPAGPVRTVPLGKIHVPKAGFVRVDCRGLKKSGPAFSQRCDLVLSSATPGLVVDAVKSNNKNAFYWGRRGPSVHLGYSLPPGKKIEYAYNEITVPKGEDPVGSYFMANGFGEGYYGIQVVSPTERWVLFSVWSPFHTDNPKEIPADKRVILLAKGEGVRGGEFGGEGAGGKSVLVFPWQAGVTYRFLNLVKPDGQGHSIYSAWFGEVGKPGWRLIARFQRPATDKYLTGFHSFLENFKDTQGYQGRRVLYTNQWVRDHEGGWHEVTSAHFTGDGTASGRNRLDYAGGLAGSGFYLRNGGFFADTVSLNQTFQRPSRPAGKPNIDVSTLP